MTARPTFNPDDIEIEPGLTVGDLATKEDLHRALGILEYDVAEIKAKLQNADENASADWRRRAEAALRMKKHGLSAVRARFSILREANRAEAMAAVEAHLPDGPVLRAKRRQALLDTIEEKIGTDEFQRYLTLTKQRRPELFPGHVVEATP